MAFDGRASEVFTVAKLRVNNVGKLAVLPATRLFMAASLTRTSSTFGWHPQIRKHFHLGLSHVLV